MTVKDENERLEELGIEINGAKFRYKVRVTQLRYGEVEVEAYNEEQAKTIANGSEIKWFDSEITDMTAENTDICDRAYEVTEVCPGCDREVTMAWNTDKDGFKAFCPYCSNRLMLCDECRHSNNGGDCGYDGQSDSCRHDPIEYGKDNAGHCDLHYFFHIYKITFLIHRMSINQRVNVAN